MKIISHRGYWKGKNEKNTSCAFERSFSGGFGTETDIRDYMGNLVISHDIANNNCIIVEDFFSIYRQYANNTLPLALNIKADGLQFQLRNLLELNNIHDYFVFDMTIPDTMGYIKEGLRFYSRQSEYEMDPAFYDKCAGIWLDAFHNIWYSNKLIKDHLNNNKQVAIVSPELHSRDHVNLWEQLKKDGLHNHDHVLLCTDFPEQAFAFFNDVK
ncbi:MAG: hypothetical protein ABIW34_08125 [Ginsengibacter sp.]